MKTYWDHTEKERAALTEEDVRRLLDFELMDKGVLKVVAPKLETITDVSLPKRKAFEIRHGDYGNYTLDSTFDSAEEAQRFLDLNPAERVDDWETRTKYFRRLVKPTIAQIDITDEQSVLNAKVVLLENRQKSERNEKASREFAEASKAVDSATKGVWEDWSDCRELQRKHEKIIGTLEEYKRLTDGNVEMARAFLRKAFSESDVAAAFAWFDPETSAA